MTKTEYMNQLQEKLEHFSRELQEDIIEDYKQHFAEGELQGKTDEEIIQELGAIEDMIRDLPASDLKESIGSQIQNMTDMSNHVSQSVSENVSEIGKSSSPAGTAITESTSTDKTKQAFTCPGTYKAIVLNGEDADIHLEDSQDDQIHIEYINRSKNAIEYEYYEYEENGIFYAGVRKKKDREGHPQGKENRKSWKITLFGETIISYGNMKNIHDNINASLSVKVPAQIRRLHTKVTSGDIHIPHLTKEELLLESASGDIKAYRITSDALRIQVASGDMDISDITCRNKLEIRTHSGDITLKRASADQLAIAVTSGDVSISGVKCRQAQTQGISGDVSITDITAESLEIQSSSGDIGIASSALKLLNAEVSSGDISISGTNFAVGNLSARSGDLSFSGIHFETGNFTSSQGDISVINSEFAVGKLLTKNGDIAIRSKMKTCECTANGGDISISAEEPGKLSLQSISGDLDVNTTGTPESIVLRSDNGDICLKMSQTQGMEVNMDAGWGDVEIRWEGENRNMKKGVCTYGNGASKVTVCCKRGDVNISGSRR